MQCENQKLFLNDLSQNNPSKLSCDIHLDVRILCASMYWMHFKENKHNVKRRGKYLFIMYWKIVYGLL